MVWVSRVLLRQYGRFMDDLRIYVRGGSGGMGFPRLGGEGGKGGDVWLVAQEKLTLKKIKDRYPKKRFVAGTGSNRELNKAGERLLVARGGIGGCLATNFLPSKGQNQMIHLDLKLIADVGLVGFPNAGKSSLLTKISHATPQIADYAFTTIKPELGTIKYADFKQITVADLPGLIEGAHANKGRGHSFLKHVERTNQLLFVVDVSGFQLASTMPFRTAFETVILLAKELELYKEELRTKPAILAVNKMDLPNAQEKLDEFMEQLQNPCDYMQSLPTGMIPENPVKFKEIVPISTYSGEGIEKIIMCIRKVLDEEAEKKIEDYQRKQIHSLHLSESS
ncbi:GTP-binding protein 10 isoform X2 [Varanus komodoensis]|uniref:GTP-binding protein 10 isoform X2 n=1 Tax=Varanus komodoensis TaxID=61221 RepID=UPI001CF7D7DB|nr:GTP-binding protein 10 isoform X2 [Varanus komodoensis]